VTPQSAYQIDRTAAAATREQIDGALALVRSPEFVMMSPLSIAVRGRVPCGPTSAPVFI
jgi:hypothetical protein